MKKYILKGVSVEITNQCNLRCKLCNIWKEKNKILPLESIKLLLFSLLNSYNISSVPITGGEPFLHPQFDAILQFLILLQTKGKIDAIGIYSNGYSTDRIKEILDRNKKFIYDISLGISLDGMEKEHNFLRGKDDAFKYTLKTIEYVNHNFKNSIRLAIKFTISECNYFLIYEMYKFCKENNMYFRPKFAEYMVKNYYHRSATPQKTFLLQKPEIKYSIKNQLLKILKEEQKTQYYYIRPKIIRMLIRLTELETDFIESCLTPSQYLYITSQGNIYPCLYLKSIGKIKNISRIVFNAQHRRIIQKGLKGNCPKCYAYHGFLKEVNFPINNSYRSGRENKISNKK